MRVITDEERTLVETHMGLVESVLQRYITPRPEIPGMEHDDLFQVGSLALCRAAQKYDGRCKFSTFAYAVVKNSLIDYCRSIMCQQRSVISAERVTEDGDRVSLLEALPDPQAIADSAEAHELLRTLTDAKQRYRGIARKGVQAIEMQIYDYSTREIAAMYGVRTNVVSAWVSRARKLLIREVEMPAYANRA